MVFNIIRAEKSGLCFGVKRALELAEEISQHSPVLCLGPLLHNEQEVKRLEGLGIRTITDVEGTGPETILIRTHGITPQAYRDLEEHGRHVKDATCPYVQKAQRLAQQAFEEGYQVVLLGDASHPEVIALQGWTGNHGIIVRSYQELEGVVLPQKVALMAQTTEKQSRFQELVQALQGKVEDLKVYNTICSATHDRQQAAAELAPRVDVMIVIGGKHSSNTRKLWEICQKINPCTVLIEEASELQEQWLKGKHTIGITAGASTPDWIIKEVIEEMEDMKERENISGEKAEVIAEQTEVTTKQAEVVDVQAEVADVQADVVSEQVEVIVVPVNADSEEEMTSMEDMLDFQSFRPGDVVKGRVVKIMGDQVLLEIGGKSEGIIPAEELAYRKADPRELVSLGEEILVEVLKEDREGNIILSRKNALAEETFNKLEAHFQQGTFIEAPVIEIVKGGLLVDVGIRGFVPASHISRRFVEDFTPYLQQVLKFKIIELDRKARKAVLSHKAVLEQEQKVQQEELWADLAEGQVKKGVVKRLATFGAFVDIGGIDGLLHVSEMSWGRMVKPEEIVKEDDLIEVEIIKIDRETKKIALSLKKLLANPWEQVLKHYKVGQVFEGKVVRTAPFGAFIEIEAGIEGLAHISQVSSKRIKQVEDVVKAGDVVQAKIIEIDAEKNRIGLSLKELESDAEQAEVQGFIDQQKEDDEAPVTIGEAFREKK